MVRNTYEVQNIGDLLREKRKQLGKDIKEVAAHTKIRVEYLLALETGAYDKFASDVYAKGFLKKYAKYLGINPDRAAAMYRREKQPQKSAKLQSTNYLRTKINQPKFQFSGGRIAALLGLLVILVVVYYLFSQLSTVLKSPQLSLIAPIAANAGTPTTYTTSLEKVTLRGNLELGSTLNLNGTKVNVNNLQLFEVTDLPLNLGENQFTLTATSQFGQKSELKLLVIRDKLAESAPQVAGTTNSTTPSTSAASQLAAQIKIKGTDAYLRVQVDGQPVLAQTLAPGTTKEYTAQTTLAVSSPRPYAVEIIINGKSYNLSSPNTHEYALNSDGSISVSN